MLERIRTASTAAVAGARVGPIALVVTRDGELFEHVLRLAPTSWSVEACIDGRSGREWLARAGVRLVIIDDEALLQSERGWLLDQIHRRAIDAGIVYVAGRHAPEVERAVRARGVLYYTSRPIDSSRLDSVLLSVFERNRD